MHCTYIVCISYVVCSKYNISTESKFYLFSVQNIHTALTESYGLPAWASYVIFGVATVLTGLILGMVCIPFLCRYLLAYK